MPATPILPENWLPPRGYSHGMRARGELIAIAGQVAWDERGRMVGDSFIAQFEQALKNVVAVVRAAGAKQEDIISLTIFVTDKTEYLAALSALGGVWKKLLGKHYPAMALVEVHSLLENAAKVEIQGLAVGP